MAPPSTTDRDTAQRALDIASRLVQTRGFNGFSYADIAAELGITKASLHYHFAAKAELGRVLVDRYAGEFGLALERIDRDGKDEADKLRRYVAVYDGVLAEGRMCLCGMLAAEYDTLPPAMQQALTRFFDLNEAWLVGVFERGRRKAQLVFTGSPREAARLLVGGLEGAMMLARSYGDAARFRTTARVLLLHFGTTAPAAGATPRRSPAAKARAAGKSQAA